MAIGRIWDDRMIMRALQRISKICATNSYRMIVDDNLTRGIPLWAPVTR
jgi:hypothetical protein